MRKQHRRVVKRAPRLKLPNVTDPFPTVDEITTLAQEMLVSHRHNAGTSGIRAYWRAAEAQLLDRAARRLFRPPHPPPSAPSA